MLVVVVVNKEEMAKAKYYSFTATFMHIGALCVQGHLQRQGGKMMEESPFRFDLECFVQLHKGVIISMQNFSFI